MALARERTPQSSQQSAQGFDPDFFSRGCSVDGHLASLLDVHLQDSQSIVDFKAAAADRYAAHPSTSSVLSFEHRNLDQEEGYYCAAWIDATGHDCRLDRRHGYGCMDGRQGEDQFGLLCPSVSGAADCQPIERTSQKRPYMGGDMQAAKKLCGNINRKAKAKPSSSSAKDPQSIAAKNRRERISERLKVLQELVPNGTKVDLVTMLEKAMSYVKFLQLQVKVLATDEFWPAQGGKPPEVAQVKEAIDTILSSHRGRN